MHSNLRHSRITMPLKRSRKIQIEGQDIATDTKVLRILVFLLDGCFAPLGVWAVQLWGVAGRLFRSIQGCRGCNKARACCQGRDSQAWWCFGVLRGGGMSGPSPRLQQRLAHFLPKILNVVEGSWRQWCCTFFSQPPGRDGYLLSPHVYNQSAQDLLQNSNMKQRMKIQFDSTTGYVATTALIVVETPLQQGYGAISVQQLWRA